MPFKKLRYRHWQLAAIAFLILFNLFGGLWLPKEVRAARLPVAVEAMQLELTINWDGVKEEDIPDFLEFTVIPDGIAFMATGIYLDEELDWQNEVEIHLGTRTVQFKGLDIEGLDFRILGGIEEGYTIEYYPVGEIPDDDAELADLELPTDEQVVLDPVPSKTVVKDDAPLPIETREGEQLSDEEIRERLVEQSLREQGYILDKTPYYIGIAVCVLLIIIVIIIRVLLGRS